MGDVIAQWRSIKEQVAKFPFREDIPVEIDARDGVVVSANGFPPVMICSGTPERPFEVITRDKDYVWQVIRVNDAATAVKEMRRLAGEQNLLKLAA